MKNFREFTTTKVQIYNNNTFVKIINEYKICLMINVIDGNFFIYPLTDTNHYVGMRSEYFGIQEKIFYQNEYGFKIQLNENYKLLKIIYKKVLGL